MPETPTRPAPRVLPPLTDRNRPYWTGGFDGELLIQWCPACARFQHPPRRACAACGGTIEPRAVSGKGTIFTFTINEYQYNPAVPPPYVIAVVELVEQDNLRLPTNIEGADPGDVRVGLPVHVTFEIDAAHPDHAVPLFTLD
ncbi:MAG: OB-fold domain-containing protein [Ilumatobacteraceae bacterium]